MAKAEHATHSGAHKSYAKRISDHVAVALVVYTLALIFVTSPAMESKGTSILPYFMLVIFVAMVIPACRNMERRWIKLEASELGHGGLETRFTADRVKLWVAALGIPVLLAVLCTIF
jgi:cell division protein FtsW (lipid II flippase)